MASNIDIVQACIQSAWNAGDLNRIDEFYTETFKAHYPPVGPPWGEGPGGVRNVVKIVRTAFPDYTEHVEEIHAVDDRVFVRMRNTGTHSGPFPLAPSPTHRSVEFADFLHVRLEDGRLAEQWGLLDTVGLFVQLGILKPPSAT